MNNLRYADDNTLMAKSKEELKSLWMKLKEESEKADLKLSIQKTNIMASGPNTSWHIDRETMETVKDFSFSWTPKSLWTVTAAMKLKDTCSLEEKLWKSRQLIKNQRHYFADKGPHSQSYGFSSSQVWCESWAIKKAESWRIDPFELWCWRRLLRVPWTASQS